MKRKVLGRVECPVARALDIYCAETGRTWRNMAGYNGLGEIEIP